MTLSAESIAAVVVHYKSPSTLKNTVEILGKSIDPARIFVVDNSSSLSKGKFLGLATILDDGLNRGYAGGVNHGFKHVCSQLPEVKEVLVCTHETVFRDNSLEELQKTAAAHPEGHLVGPKLITQDQQGRHITWSNGGQLSLPFFYPTHDTSPSASGENAVDWIDGAAFIMDTNTWRVLGGVPEEFFMYMEDVALGLRCKAAGIPVLVNLDAVVEQTANGPSRRLAIRNRMLLALRYMGPLTRLVVAMEVRGRQWLMSVHPSKDVRDRAEESRDAVKEARRMACALPGPGLPIATPPAHSGS